MKESECARAEQGIMTTFLLASRLLVVFMALCAVGVAHAQITPADLAHRDLHLNTVLVAGGQPQCVIISSTRQPAYAAIAASVQQRLQELSNSTVPIVDAATVTTDDLLAKTNAIVLGNLATSPFVEDLYWQWYTITDLWYPGKGGHEVRTLHDPYATGHNVILIGGSDDAGVKESADVFCRLLQPGEPLQVGRLMDLKLGEGCLPPKPQNFTDWVDWRWRIFRDVQGAPVGHTLASKIGLIYYYSGEEQAAQRFRKLALETDQLSKSNHYNAHMNALVWDLIEESPVFSDADRQQITAKLLEHVRGPDSAGHIETLAEYDKNPWLLDRHSSMMAICALTESRYLNKYWPSPEWARNLEVVRKYFDRQMVTAKGDSDLGGRGIYTYLECALIPALLLRDHRFIDSGALRQWGELCLMHCDNTGQMPQSGQSGFLSYPAFALPITAALLHDGSFLATMPRREEAEKIANTSVTPTSFMTGQAWSIGLQPQPMAKMIGVYHLPLTQWEWEVRGKAVPIEKTFDKLTMRTGFERDDQYLLLDGLHGGPVGKPWPDVNAIVAFGQNGRILIDNTGAGESPVQHNVVTVARDGLREETDTVASLEATANLPHFGYSHSRVNKYVFSSWDRHIFWRKGGWFVVMDRLVADGPGKYGFECQWQTVGQPKLDGSDYTSSVWEWAKDNAPHDVLNIKSAEHLPLRYTHETMGVEGGVIETDRWNTYTKEQGMNRVRQVAARTMQQGDEQVFTNLIYVGGDRTKASYAIVKLGPTVAALTGDETAFLGTDQFQREGLSVRGAAYCISPSSVAVVQGASFEGLGMSLQAAVPCNFEIETSTGRVTCEATVPTTVTIGGQKHECPVGVSSFDTRPVSPAQRAALTSQIEQVASQASAPKPEAGPAPPALAPAWTHDLASPVTAVYAADGAVLAGLEDGRVVCLDTSGNEQWTFKAEKAVHAVATAKLAAGPVVLAGSDDQNVYALNAQTGQLLWKHQCQMARDMAGWTTGQEAKAQAILPADLDGDGAVEIICGTGGGAVETLTETGQVKWFTPIYYGVPDRLAVVPMPDGAKSLLVSCGLKSYQSMTRRLDAQGKIVDENAMYRQRGADMSPAPGLLVSDLEGDGKPEAIVGRGGAYAELAVYDAAANGKPRWQHLLADNVTCLATADLTGDGVADIIAASPSSWVTAFDSDGHPLWATAMPHEVRALVAAPSGLLVACGDGATYAVSPTGEVTRRYVHRGIPSTRFAVSGQEHLIGDAAGTLTAFAPAP